MLNKNFQTNLTDQVEFFHFDYLRLIAAKKILTSTRKLILILLGSMFGKDGNIYPSDKYLAESTGMPVRNIAPHLSYLKKHGYISMVRKSGDQPRRIYLHHPVTGQKYTPSAILPYSKNNFVNEQKPYLLYKQETKKETNNSENPPETENPPPENAATDPVVVSLESKKIAIELRNQIEASIRKKIGLTLIEKLIGRYGQLKTRKLIKTVNSSDNIRSPAAYLAAASKKNWDIIVEPVEPVVNVKIEIEKQETARQQKEQIIDFSCDDDLKSKYQAMDEALKNTLFKRYLNSIKSDIVRIKRQRLGIDAIIDRPTFQIWIAKQKEMME